MAPGRLKTAEKQPSAWDRRPYALKKRRGARGHFTDTIRPAGSASDPLDRLALADPELAADVAGRLATPGDVPDPAAVEMLVEHTLGAMAQEIGFGRAVAMGCAALIRDADAGDLERYCQRVRTAGSQGPTFGRTLAVFLVPVLTCPDGRVMPAFDRAVGAMAQKGTYTLDRPLEAMTRLLSEGDHRTTLEYLGLLREVFTLDLTYNQAQRCAVDIPRAVLNMTREKRPWQVRQLRRVVRVDFSLMHAFLGGLEKGLSTLREQALSRFVNQALDGFRRNPGLGLRFLALESKVGTDSFHDLQVTVPLFQVLPGLDRYIRARTDGRAAVRPMSALPLSGEFLRKTGPSVCSDGRFVYLPEEIDCWGTRRENTDLYKILTKLEAGLTEFGTFDFDLEKWSLRNPAPGRAWAEPAGRPLSQEGDARGHSDLERFFRLFQDTGLAADLFTVFEHGRQRVLTGRRYPGLARTALPVLQRAALNAGDGGRTLHPVQALYHRIALDLTAQEASALDSGNRHIVEAAVGRFRGVVEDRLEVPVETSADLAAETYLHVVNRVPRTPAGSGAGPAAVPISLPFHRRIRPDLAHAARARHHCQAALLQEALSRAGIRVYRSDLVRGLVRNRGVLCEADILDMARNHPATDGGQVPIDGDPPWDRFPVDLSAFFEGRPRAAVNGGPADAEVFTYREWDHRLQDYLGDHVRVRERRAAGSGSGFYAATLDSHPGLVRRIRHGFERIRPTGLSLLRRWVEGDTFDYRAMLDYAVDKRSGQTPSERIYNKRIKHIRDVAVLLLMDLSRSTAHPVRGGDRSVLDIEKAAVVLFCEALGIVGDTFAVAGFSGTGRLGVDYYRVKDFDEPVCKAVAERIGALSPQRSTRMGAAIRHAAARFKGVASRVRLLMILGDGFPNDVDYKQDYAIEDTRRAIAEAGSEGLRTHAITVGMGADPRLDRLYGRVRHTVISDVRDLPDKLPAVYGALTRT